jgi:hypothetical protein
VFREHGDLEDIRPQFSGDEETLAARVVSDAIKDGFVTGELVAGHEAFEVDPAKDATGCGRDAGYAVGVPDVRVDFAVDEFEFVELTDRLAAILDDDPAEFPEGIGIEEAEGGCTVAEDE